jgi:type I restriction enzyme R subunit
MDVQTCRLIVIDRSVQSMTEFKQIIGRGTRIHEETGKYYFTIMDFRQATDHFADPDFDGKPIPNLAFPGPPKDAGVEDAGDEPETDETILAGGEIEPNPIQKTYIDGVEVQLILNRVQYLDAHGRLITESLRTFTRTALLKRFASLDQFLQTWNGADRKQVIVEELADEGLLLEALADEINRDLDPFDLICYVAFDRKPLTRKERAENVRKRDVFAKYGPQARAVLDALLSKYEDGLSNIEDPRILQISPLDSLGTPLQLVNEFGGLTKYQSAVAELEAALYEEAA